MAPLDLAHTADHACLFNLDLFEKVLSYIFVGGTLHVDFYDRTQSKQSLFRIALSCRAWSEPALKVLWRRLDNPLPLIKLLRKVKEANGQWCIDGHLSARDWERFDKYSVHVRELLCSPAMPDLDNDLLAVLADHRRPILPNLVMTYCPREPSQISVPWEMLLFGESIMREPSTLPISLGLAPRLTHLIIYQFPSSFSRLSSVFGSLRCLEIMVPGPIASYSDKILLPFLESLIIHHDPRETPLPAFSLPRLRYLSINSHLEWAQGFLDTLTAKEVQLISFKEEHGSGVWPGV
ncbi:hypothetical protein MSAN_00599200 [Mycena sanguinolenta]|uniref:F-box domain-containing protein n=1 Tax=Mycena sanguinolenta TaxID=230812 RepID=A0A8H7DGW3_9AGAR|nr:hypothetical protein MSAN_00599200 [Mycena sanguinolenta]